MPENYDHYISINIKAFYKRRLAAPIIYLIVLILAWHFFSLSAVFSPDILPDDTSLETAFRGGKQYINTTLSDLKFTGYTQSIFGHTNGYYYYTMRDEECIIVLLSPNTSEEGLPSIEEVTIKGKISKGNENFDTLLSNLSTDLNWTENGIRNKVSSYYISEPGFNHVGNWILFAAIFITGIYALLCIVLSVIYAYGEDSVGGVGVVAVVVDVRLAAAHKGVRIHALCRQGLQRQGGVFAVEKAGQQAVGLGRAGGGGQRTGQQSESGSAEEAASGDFHGGVLL